MLDPKVVEALMSPRRPDVPAELADLTPREREVLAAMAEGDSNASVAARLYLSERAVEKHISAIFLKLGLSEEREVHRRVMAVLAYLRATAGFRASGRGSDFGEPDLVDRIEALGGRVAVASDGAVVEIDGPRADRPHRRACGDGAGALSARAAP